MAESHQDMQGIYGIYAERLALTARAPDHASAKVPSTAEPRSASRRATAAAFAGHNQAASDEPRGRLVQMRLTALSLSVLLSAGAAAAAQDAGRATRSFKAQALPAKIIAAIDAAQVQRAGRLELLYGLPINGADTDGGRLACARVVTAILRLERS